MKNSTPPKGLLTMAANSIGLPEDIPLRSLEAVRTADLLIFEEDKPARAVLKAAGIHQSYLKYNEQHQNDTLIELEKTLLEGKSVVYMSDQGCPTLEDPGINILQTARHCKAQIKVIPGPSSLTAALSACPFPSKSFEFHGFPPRDEIERTQFLKNMLGRNKLQVLMDTPYRLKRVIETCATVFTEHCRGFLALDISGPDENYLLGPFSELQKELEGVDKKLNFVLIIYPSQIKKKTTPQKAPSKMANQGSDKRGYNKPRRR